MPRIEDYADRFRVSYPWLDTSVEILKQDSYISRFIYYDCEGEKSIPLRWQKGIYLISDGTAVKIGMATQKGVYTRVPTFQIGNPRLVEIVGMIKSTDYNASKYLNPPSHISCFGMESHRALERPLHRALAPLRIRGEWFELEAIEFLQAAAELVLDRSMPITVSD